MDLNLDTSVRFVPRVGPAMAAKLKRLGIEAVEDLLYHIPHRYNDFSLVSTIDKIQPGETVTIRATVEKFSTFAAKSGKQIVNARVADATGHLDMIWFNQIFLRGIIRPGLTFAFSGGISWFGNKLVMNSPQYEIIESGDQDSLHTGRLVPVYPETEGLTSKWIRARTAFLLDTMLPNLTDFLPDKIRLKYQLIDLPRALRAVHFPQHPEDIRDGRRRIAFDEVFTLQLRSYLQRKQWEQTRKSIPLPLSEKQRQHFLASLPFVLTDDQRQSLEEIARDISGSVPMHRLLIGDVGSGKTVVAASAVYTCALSKKTAILLAPTQILAQQHYNTIKNLLEPLDVSVDLVTAAHKKEKRSPDVLVGTHALLSDTLQFPKLGLVIIDEQHRFGVDQRAILLQPNKKGETPHVLMMSATPIPRTIAKTLLGSTDLSILTQMPSGRQRVKTWVVPNRKRDNAYAWLDAQIEKTGGQVFVVCPLIEQSETLTAVRAVKKEFEALRSRFPNRSLGLLHGRLKPKEKDTVIDRFRSGHHHILVATPVVEVGIDIPNATVMVIEAADRFGLGQLHQLRGRVGRGTNQSYCLLFSESEDEKALKRIKSLEKVHNGPDLAAIDLDIRGPGEVFGTRQHGVPDLKIASFTDMDTIHQTQEALAQLTNYDPDLAAFPLLRQKAQKSKID